MGDPKRILIKIPSRGRGWDWLRPWLELKTSAETKLLISLDDDDKSVSSAPEWAKECTKVWGQSHHKIHAINRDINEYEGEWDVLIVGSDDMVPTLKGYDELIARECPEDGCLWLPTENSSVHKRGGHAMIPGSPAYLKHWICMLPIMSRSYYEQFGYVYHPTYKAFWCDNEQTEIARNAGKLKFLNRRDVIYHQHPDWHEHGVRDETYASYPTNIYLIDRANYRKRKARNFK